MVALERINVCETVGRKSNCKLHFFSMYFVRKNEEIHLSFKNSEKLQTQDLNMNEVDKEICTDQADYITILKPIDISKERERD